MKTRGLLLLALLACPGLRADPLAAEHAAEAQRLRQEGTGLARRDGERLLLARLKTGDAPVVLTDLPTCDRHENCALHSWQGLRGGRRFHEVRQRRYEGESWWWIDRQTGRHFELEDRPQQAPDGRHLLVASEAEAHARQGLWLWAVTPLGLAPRWALEDRMFRFLAWEAPTRARVLRLAYDSKCKGGLRGQSEHLLIQPDGSARLEPLPEPPRCI